MIPSFPGCVGLPARDCQIANSPAGGFLGLERHLRTCHRAVVAYCKATAVNRTGIWEPALALRALLRIVGRADNLTTLALRSRSGFAGAAPTITRRSAVAFTEPSVLVGIEAFKR
jgi:hypothetical protein